MEFIFAQITSFLAYVCFSASLFQKSKDGVVLINLLGNVMLAISFYLLDATTAVVLSIMAIFRLAVFYVSGKNNIKSITIFVVFLILNILSCIYSWEGLISVILTLGHMVFTFGLWQKEKHMLLICGYCLSFSIIVYSLFHAAYVTIAMEIIVSSISLWVLFSEQKKLKQAKKV